MPVFTGTGPKPALLVRYGVLGVPAGCTRAGAGGCQGGAYLV